MHIQTWAQIVADVQLNWHLYVAMPFVAAAIGYVTKIVAIRMMFEPIEFIGKPPYLGWQGIVPRKAAIMAGIACDTMTTKLIRPEDVFGKLDPDRIAQELEKPLLGAVDDIVREVAEQYSPGLWEAAPDAIKQLIIRRIQEEAPNIVRDIMIDIKKNIDSVFNLKDMVVTNLLRDKPLLNSIFLEVGHKEFAFIRNSGLFFGFLIGIVQAVVWGLTQNVWVMPLFGGFTGWFTDWLALKMIFSPKYPTKYLGGLIRWHGLFMKHREDVSAEYGRMIARQIVTPKNIIDAILRGPLSDRLFTMVQKQVQRVVDDQAGLAKPFVVFAVGSAKYIELKRTVSDAIIKRLPETLAHVENYAAEAMDLENMLAEKMKELSIEEFEALLHPAFEQDEWILITVGAVLGFLVGELQVHVMLHFAKHPPEATVSAIQHLTGLA
ncbi:DUF445 domain-containing protein [Sinimarinibacterium sp. NLF-5-8]|uniref:DUF445 domain-containing protein n=1 Tax=Sinimarinibacterium sp. NLF-5-8 TaxID=2698684 RepID=UPI00137B950C|nr:DUF445 domain-containing protein [Sinimarinibacterium sp. NLF-5-8]QHS10929.1 DUF445 domain-containing protein [Sinimarinibacterium sp. NLF-5-8]